MGIGDFIPDPIEHAVEKGTEWVGDRVEDAGDWTADRLDDLGWDSGADWVREQSRSVANRMGAQVDEMDLGQTDDKTELIYGSPGKLRSTAGHLHTLQKSFDDVGDGLKGLNSERLKGEAAEAFRKSVHIQPPKWFTGADAFDEAAKALEAFAETVSWAQGQAQTAIDKWKAGTKASQDAADAHKKKVDDYNKAVDRYNAQPSDKRDPSSLPPKPAGSFDDPGKKLMQDAQDILSEARKQRNTAAGAAAAKIRAARDKAPPKPSYTDQLKSGLDEVPLMIDHFEGGLLKGTAGLNNFVRGINPLDPYNITHPAEYVTNLDSLAAGLVTVANDPWGAGKQMVTDFMKDPAEGLGRLVPDIALTIATDGAGAGVKAARTADELADTAAAARRARGLHSRESKVCRGTDPIDLATGRMFLPQTDVTLPGALPLVFRRRVDSGYRLGRWFGPSWSSTVDQRLEVDDEGIVFVHEDGLLLAYPHPARPGEPVLPSHGPRWPLLRADDGAGYVIRDPAAGSVWHFADEVAHDHGEDDEGGYSGGARISVLEQVDDRNGNWISFAYDPDTGAPTGITHSGGYHLVLEATGQGPGTRITALRLAGADPAGGDQELLRYGYDGHGNLADVTNSCGRPMTFTYDEERRVTSWTDTNARSYTYEYDPQGRCVAEGGEAGHMTLRLAYETDLETGLHVTTTATPDGCTRRFFINSDCQVIAESDTLGNVTHYHYDRHHRLLSQTDPLGHTTAFHYDPAGNLTRVVRPDGRESRAEYALLEADHSETDGQVGIGDADSAMPAGHLMPAALPVRVSGPDGLTWHQTYDTRGNRTTLTDPTGATTTYSYDEAGHLTSVTDAMGHRTDIRCNRAGLPLEIRDPLGTVTRYEHDAFGRLITLTDPLGAVTRLEWTVEGYLARRTGPDGAVEAWTYDGEGNCTSHTDPVGGTTLFEFTHFDLLTARTDPSGARHEFSHNTRLLLTRVTNPQGLTWDYEHDSEGRLTAETDFDGRRLTYTHDQVGRLASRTNTLGETITFEHDALGRVTRKDAAGGVTTYTYDFTDQLAQATGPDGTTMTLLRDQYGRVQSETVDGRVLAYGYDALGRRTRRTTPSGVESAWAYDAAGRPATLTTAGRTLTFDRDAAGRELARHLGQGAAGPGVTLAHTFDQLGRLTSQSLYQRPSEARGGRAVAHRTYTYRADGSLTGIEDTRTGTRRFELDRAGRVTAVHAANWSERYAYDEMGNQTEASWPESHPGREARGSRAYTGTRVTRAGDVHYTHDAAGRITLRRKARLSRKPDIWRYTWDAENRLTGLVTPDGSRWRYTYDPLGRRTAKQRLAGDGETVIEQTTFTWDGTTLCEQVTTGDAQPHPVTLTWEHNGLHPLTQTERIIPSAAGAELAGVSPASSSSLSMLTTLTSATPEEDRPADVTSDDEIASRFFAVITDLVGTPTELIDDQGTVAWRTRTTLWGTTTWNRSAITYTPLRFPGQYYDPESGLHYNFFRHYDPEVARYVTPDPLGLGPAPNPVTYIHNPLQWTDSLGLGSDYNPEFDTRREAFNHAKDMAGVPHSAQPTRQWEIGGDPTQAHRPNYVYRPYDPNADPTRDPRAGWGRYYQYDTPNGTRVIAEHTADPLAPHPHFHAGKPPAGAPGDINMQGKTYKQIMPKHHLYYPQKSCYGE
ncbi:hypothetical protein GCM10018793_37380 [Streptomyces sulfonofaciens]|uniref:Type IV secretion protein Rhs n=1 Tax=Streptomyces sulfonofaciens TaxID=68272 RepID=A0A919GBI5_9ACTN|nr:DUF6531 domain-containing protein [Streptomyces sulfonofaciens]GHH80971.1 hypothetical protein GCM10018793_37380 [Streptomyces sulfonofaciens]